MFVKKINPDGQTVELQVGDPSYQHLMIGTIRERGREGFVVAVRDISGITSDTDGWRIYVDRYLIKDINLLVARTDPFGDTPASPDYVGGDDPLDFQLAFSYGGHMYQIGNRVNKMDDKPIQRINPDGAEVTFERNNTMVDVRLV
jgi:hypothetical protein